MGELEYIQAKEKTKRIRQQMKLINLYNHAVRNERREEAGAVLAVIAEAVYRGDFDVKYVDAYCPRSRNPSGYIEVLDLKDED